MKPITLAIGLVSATLLCAGGQARGIVPDHSITRAVADPDATRS